jgi:hypothetical protein
MTEVTNVPENAPVRVDPVEGPWRHDGLPERFPLNFERERSHIDGFIREWPDGAAPPIMGRARVSMPSNRSLT